MSDLREKYAKQFSVPIDRIVVSKTLLSRVLDVDGKTLDKWHAATPPLPRLVTGQQRPRVEWVYDTRDVIEWIRDRAYRNGREDGAEDLPKSTMIDPETGKAIDVPDHMITKEEADRRKAIVGWQDAQLEFDLKQKHVIYIDQAETMVGRAMAQVSERLELMRSSMVATLVRAGNGRPAVEAMIDEHILDMIEAVNTVDVSLDPMEADEADAARDMEDGSGTEETDPAA